MRASRLSSGLLVLALSCGVGLYAGESRALINGSEDTTGTYSAVARFGGGCSAVLVAPRVMLTSAHCMPIHALQCTNLAMNPLTVTFAEPNGGWSSTSSFNTRTISVEAFVQRPELFDLSQCLASDTFSCANFIDPDGSGPLPNNYNRATVNHSRELVVMYLLDDAPADVTPVPLLINPGVDATDSAAEVGVFVGLGSWVVNQVPVVTTVGYGIGSHAYQLGASQFRRGRDYGLQRWVDVESNYQDLLGATSCNVLAPSSQQPGVLVSPKDLTFAQTGAPNSVLPGADFSPSQHSHSGTGDSGGPVLVGSGIGARGDNPTSLPAPASSYDPNRNYIVGTASAYAAFGSEFATIFTPTWTFLASTFLMGALHDTDGDGYADPVDDDIDGDGCDNDVDQHPNDRFVEVGTILYPNCSPSSAPLLGDEMLDLEPDGIPNCEDTDDDGDGIPDWPNPLDACPVHANQLCIQLGPSCPWNPIFFDCILAGCNELLLKLSSLINPDPTLDLFYRVLSAEPGVVLVAPPAGLSLSEGVAALTGGIGRQSMVTADHLLLEVQGAEGVRGILAAFDPARVIVGSLEGANALELRFAADGQSLEIFGAQVESLPTQGFISSMLLILTLAGTAAWMLYGSRARLLPSPRV